MMDFDFLGEGYEEIEKSLIEYDDTFGIECQPNSRFLKMN